MENEEGLKIIFWISTSVMLLLASGFMFITLIYLRKTSKIKQKESENLLKATLDTEKKERERIASDLHDSVKGDLSALKNYISVLDSFEKSSEEKIIIDEIKMAIQEMMQNVNLINFNLMPPLLQSDGLIAAIDDYFKRVRKLNTIDAILLTDVRQLKLSVGESYQLFRIIQELTTNTTKHSTNTSIKLHLKVSEDSITLDFNDSGQKFDFFSKMGESNGMGLKNILSRINRIGADFTQCKVERGNHFKIQINKSV